MHEPPQPEPVESSLDRVAGYFARNQLEHRRHEGGALLVAIPAAGEAPPLQGVVVRQGEGWPLIVAQVRDGQAVPRPDWPAAMVRCNSWNNRIRLPKASVQVGDAATAEQGAIVVEGSLPDGAWVTQDAVDRFLDAVFQGARTFWMAAPGAPAPAPE